jgi:hypothetical protein
MKKSISLLVFLLFSTFVLAQDIDYFTQYVSYKMFESTIRSLKIDGYKIDQIEKEGSEDANSMSYTATFLTAKYQQCQLNIQKASVFDDYKILKNIKFKEPYKFEGFDAVFMYPDKNHKDQPYTLLVKLTDINACFSIAFFDIEKNQDDIEVIFKQINLKKFVEDAKKAKVEFRRTINWPPDIPEYYRLEADHPLTIQRKNSSIDSVEFEYHLYVNMDNTLEKKVRKFEALYGCCLYWMKMDEFRFACATADTYENFNKIPMNSPVKFIYYKLKKKPEEKK